VKIGKYQGYPFINGLNASQLRLVMARRLSAATVIGTFEVAFLIEHDAELFLETHAAQQSVERFAACNAVFVVAPSAIGDRNKVLDAGIGRQQDVIAEEAQPALGEQQSFNRFAARSAHLLIGSLLLRERRLSTLRALPLRSLNAHFPFLIRKKVSFQKAGRLRAERYAAIIESTKRLAGCQRNFRFGGVLRAAAICPIGQQVISRWCCNGLPLAQ
jgi:hypothetical protein